ncbi:caspase-6 isoform X2 [Sminthopsis crassicaudata]|uniref:caspase-6 isoform X2 n=1 Tax=Sminthopsis crassicaudata TaxID=9301 RepID=UPI003D68EBF6
MLILSLLKNTNRQGNPELGAGYLSLDLRVRLPRRGRGLFGPGTNRETTESFLCHLTNKETEAHDAGKTSTKTHLRQNLSSRAAAPKLRCPPRSAFPSRARLLRRAGWEEEEEEEKEKEAGWVAEEEAGAAKAARKRRTRGGRSRTSTMTSAEPRGGDFSAPGAVLNVTEMDALIKSELFDPAERYKMDHKRRGVALIFNHERFFWHLTLPERRGTRADRDNLKLRLSNLGFEVHCYDDLKAEDLLKTIHQVSSSSHVDADCFLCVFLTHGEENHIYAYDAKIDIQKLTAMFKGDKCQSLVGKPKIFIIQACRGEQHDVPVIPLDVVDYQTEEVDVNETEVDAASVYTLPAGADFLMCYSVAEGYYSHRETVNGSWYIQDFCEMLGKYGSSLEFTELLTLVNRKVSYRRVDFCKDPKAIGKKQVPCFASMMTKKLFFLPKSN